MLVEKNTTDRISACVIACLFVCTGFTQDATRTNVWYFGGNAGINFNAATPVPLLDGALNIWEGCATICDKSGQMMIYTDGIRIWNKNHQILPGATDLGGDNSATQSGIIVPLPGSPDILYVFSVDAEAGSGGLRYAVVDMTLNGGLGGMVSSNNVLLTRAAEKLTAIQHCNKTDFWIVAHEYGNNNFVIWKLSDTGLSTVPQKIAVGSVHGVHTNDAIGYLKGSPDGSKIAVAVYGSDFFELFNFDNSSGNITDPLALINPQFRNPYGVEFSPDNKLLYVAGTQNTPQLFQYNISLPTPAEIQNSLTEVGKGTASYFGAIQLAPDGKIYIAKDNSNYLSVISKPNSPGLACNFIENGFDLNGRISRLGLPNLIPAYFSPDITVSITSVYNVCNSSASLSAVVNVQDDIVGYEWYLNDMLILNETTDKITVQSSGNYKIKVLMNGGCQASTISYEKEIYVEIKNYNAVTSVNAVICEGEIYEGYSTPGQYADLFTGYQGCDSVRILNLAVLPKASVTLSETICQGQSYLGYSTSGTYIDTLRTYQGCDSVRTLHLMVLPNSRSEVSRVICEGESYGGYQTSGIYLDTFKTNQGCDSIRTLRLTVLQKPRPSLGPDREICLGDSVRLLPGEFSTYLWQDGSTNNAFMAYGAGTYSVLVENRCGKGSDEVQVKEITCKVFFPTAFTPNHDGKNDEFKILNGVDLRDYRLAIYNRWGQKVFEGQNVAKGWDGKYGGKEQASAVYVWFCEYKKDGMTRKLKGFVTLIR